MSNINLNFTSFSLLKFALFKRILCFLLILEISAKQELTINHLTQSYFLHPTLLLGSSLCGKGLWSLQEKKLYSDPNDIKIIPILKPNILFFPNGTSYPVLNTILLEVNSTNRQGKECEELRKFSLRGQVLKTTNRFPKVGVPQIFYTDLL